MLGLCSGFRRGYRRAGLRQAGLIALALLLEQESGADLLARPRLNVSLSSTKGMPSHSSPP